MSSSRIDIKVGAFGRVVLPAVALVAACFSAGPDDDPVGMARVALTQVPADVMCVEITAKGTREVVKAFDTTPGTSPTVEISGLPIGDIQFSAQTFAEKCAERTPTSVATWISDVVVAAVDKNVVTQVTLTMHRNGRAEISVDFEECGLVDLSQTENVHPLDINDDGEVVGAVTADAVLWKAGKLTPLGVGASAVAWAINNQHQIVGNDNAHSRAFIWSEGIVHYAPALAGNVTELVAINESGQAVGLSRNARGDNHAVMWQVGSEMVDLGTLGGWYSSAAAINASGQIVGSSLTFQSSQHLFLWEAGTMRDLGTLGGNAASATAINDAGQIVGDSITASGADHAFLWEAGTMHDLGTLGGSWSVAYGVNAAGQVVGRSATAPDSNDAHAFLWEAGVMRDLGTLGGAESAAALSTSELGRRSINNAGEVVGVATTALGETHAFLWKGGIMHDLGISGVQRTNAVGINQAHQIVGYSISTFDSPPRGFFFDAGTCPIGAPASGTR